VRLAAQEKFTGSNVDVRTGITFKAADAAVAKMLPEGWEVNSPAAGPTKGFNLGMTLIDQIVGQDPEGKMVEPVRGAVLNIPSKKKGTDIVATMVFAGLFTPNGTPGAYGVYQPARAIIDRKQRTDADGKISVEETWEFRGDNGNALEIQLQFVRGAMTYAKLEPRIYSAARPDFYRIYRFEQTADVARSTGTGIDRVSKISVKASGPMFSSLINGSEQIVSVTSLPYYARRVFVPGS